MAIRVPFRSGEGSAEVLGPALVHLHHVLIAILVGNVRGDEPIIAGELPGRRGTPGTFVPRSCHAGGSATAARSLTLVAVR